MFLQKPTAGCINLQTFNANLVGPTYWPCSSLKYFQDFLKIFVALYFNILSILYGGCRCFLFLHFKVSTILIILLFLLHLRITLIHLFTIS